MNMMIIIMNNIDDEGPHLLGFRHFPAFPRMSLCSCAPTVPCLRHERYLLRTDRQARLSCNRIIRSTTMASIADGANGAASVQALSAYFRDLDSIQEELEQALGDWETPVVLVFGAESAGKSTILERVAMLPLFPKGDGICTRLPILVQLRQSKDDRATTAHRRRG